jgi:hypothetical protein
MLAVGGSDSATETFKDDFSSSSSSFSIGDGTEEGLFSLTTGEGAGVVDVGLGVTGLGAVIASGLGVVVESGDGVVIDPEIKSGDGATAGVVWLIVSLAATSDDAEGDKESGVGAGAGADAGARAAVSSSEAVTLA